jgi:hypothetical protein
VFRSDTQVDVFYRDAADGIAQSWYVSDQGWHGPLEVMGTAGTAASPPTEAVWRSGSELDVFYFSTAGALTQLAYANGAWNGPAVPTSAAVTPPVAPTPPASSPSPSPSPSGAAQSTPTTITPPPVTRHARPRVRVTLAITWRWSTAGTRIRRVRVFGFPVRARLTVACAGRGCPPRAERASRRGLSRLWRRLEGWVYQPGDRITITITEPGFIRERARVHIWRDRTPTAQLVRR